MRYWDTAENAVSVQQEKFAAASVASKVGQDKIAKIDSLCQKASVRVNEISGDL